MIIIYFYISVAYAQLDQLQKCDRDSLCDATQFNAELHLTMHSQPDRSGKNPYLMQVVQSLIKNSESTHVIAEISSFKSFYEGLDAELQNTVAYLISSGRLDIVNGGWVQNDQACTNYQDIILQLQIGHQWVYKTFNHSIKTAWNIDSYGHSHTQSALNYLFNMKQQILERVDVNDILQRVKKGTMEFIFRSSPYNYEMLTHLRFRRHGGAGQASLVQLNNGFCIQVYNQLREFEQLLFYQKQGGLGDHLFHYETYINETSLESQSIIVEFYNVFHCRMLNVVWSTPTRYFEALRSSPAIENITYKNGDFFPHFEDGAYFSAIYVNNPVLKKTLRWMALQLQAYQLFTLQNKLQLSTNLRDLIATAQQSIAGTGKYSVLDELLQQIQSEYESVQMKVNHGPQLELVAQLKHNTFHHKKIVLDCAQNIKCVQEYFIKNRRLKSVIVLLYNPQHAQEKIFELEVPSKNVQMLDSAGNILPIQEVKVFNDTIVLVFKVHMNGYCEEQFVLNFNCSLDCAPINDFVLHLDLSEQIKHLERQFEQGEPIEAMSWSESIQDVSVEISRQGIDYEFIFSYGNGSVSIKYNYYPNQMQPKKSPISQPGKSVLMNDYNNGGLICSFEKMYCLKEKSSFQEIMMQCGKIYTLSLLFGEGIELRTYMQANTLTMGDYTMMVTFHHLQENTQFYTDSNGLYMLKRELFKRENYDPLCSENDQINCNTYPLTAYALLKGETHQASLITDRSQGVFSLNSQTIEIILEHLAGDDGVGVGEVCSRRNNHSFRHLVQFDAECIRCSWNEFQYQNELKRLSNQFHQKHYLPIEGDRRLRLEFQRTSFQELILYAENLSEQPTNVIVLNQTIIQQILQDNNITLISAYLNGIPAPAGNLTLQPMEIKAFLLQ